MRARALLAERLVQQGFALSAVSLPLVLSQNAESACVPTSIMTSTVKAATLFAAGQGAVTESMSAKTAALAEGVLKSMLFARLKIASAVFAAVSMISVGAVFVAYQTQALAQKERRPLNEPVVGRNFAIVPVATDLQRAAGIKYKNAQVYVLINGARLFSKNDLTLNTEAIDHKALTKVMETYIKAGGRGTGIFEIVTGSGFKMAPDGGWSASGVFVEFMEQRARGWFSDSDVRLSIEPQDSESWETLVRALTKVPSPSDIQAEAGVGDAQVKVYPVVTPLSRHLYGKDIDCVIRVIPPIEEAKPDIAENARRSLDKLKLKSNKVVFLYYWKKVGPANAAAQKLFEAKAFKDLPGFEYGQMLWDTGQQSVADQ